MPLLGVKVEYRSKRMKGFHWCVCRVSQLGEGRDQPYRTGTLGHLVGCSQLVHRNVEVSRKCELEKKIAMHQEDGSSQFCHF